MSFSTSKRLSTSWTRRRCIRCSKVGVTFFMYVACAPTLAATRTESIFSAYGAAAVRWQTATSENTRVALRMTDVFVERSHQIIRHVGTILQLDDTSLVRVS